MKERIGIYPGTFDPVTYGHLDIIKRGLNLFDKLYIVIPINYQKRTVFSTEERLDLLIKAMQEMNIYDEKKIIVTSTDMLSTDYAKSVGAFAMLRGLRMVSDFEYELQLSAINKMLDENIETIFIMSSHDLSFLSSSKVNEIARFNGDTSPFVPKTVSEALKLKYQK